MLYALYWFVGIFGAGTLVGLLEDKLFGLLIYPWVVGWVERLIASPFVVDLLVGQYGLWTLGMTYALALILPIVTTFFLAFGVPEDTGYLPRLAVLTNRLFQRLGLNGKAVLPMVLGLGCDTMATMTTRILDTEKDRTIVTLLLALGVPCSAQLGVILGMFANLPTLYLLIWIFVRTSPESPRRPLFQRAARPSGTRLPYPRAALRAFPRENRRPDPAA